MRIRITFAKTEAMRFTSHLDLHRAWERTFRRARLPLAYTQGFSPHPRLNLACALPLGFTSECEVLDAWLESDMPASEIEAALIKTAPPGIQIQQIEEASERAPALQTELEAAEYLITFLAPVLELDTQLQALAQSEHLPRQRRGKDYDLRPLILELRQEPEDDLGRQQVAARLAALPGATGRPEEVVAALGAKPEEARIQRTRLVFRQEQPANGGA